MPEGHSSRSPLSMGALVTVDSVFSGHNLTDGREALLLTVLFCRSHSVRPRLERCLTSEFRLSDG